jgi:2-iminobutanoate/2-iminopropanoate deaminase
MKQIIFTEKAPAAIGPYSQAVLSNGTLYVSGQIALALVEAGANIEDETRQVMKNMQAILEAANMTFENVVKCSIFVKDMNNFVKINGVYGEFFPSNPPARETVEVARLPKDVNVEISCIAVN